jgi:ribosome recycling factor
VRIDYYGAPTSIFQVAKISVPEPRMLLVSCIYSFTIGKIVHRAILCVVKLFSEKKLAVERILIYIVLVCRQIYFQ